MAAAWTGVTPARESTQPACERAATLPPPLGSGSSHWLTWGLGWWLVAPRYLLHDTAVGRVATAEGFSGRTGP